MDGSFDIRRYIDVLFKYWWLILTCTVLAGLAAFAVHFLTPPTYEATAGILIARTYTQVVFDPRFQTVESSDLLRGYSIQEADARRWSLAALVQNGYIASQVSEQLAGELSADERDPSRLLSMVSATVKEALSQGRQASSDYIVIKVTAANPAKAKLIADAWARVYEEYVNEIYGKDAESYSSVQRQAETTKAAYQQTEQALIDFDAQSQANELQRQMAEKQQLISDLQTSRQAALTAMIQAEQNELNDYYATRRKLLLLLEDARALQRQIQQSETPNPQTNELALVLLKAEVFASSAELPADLQLQIDLGGDTPPNPAEQAADLEALIAVIEERLAQVEVAIDGQTQILLSGSGPDSPANTTALDETIYGLQEEVNQLQAELSQVYASRRELARARDLAWDTYVTLQVKLAELGITSELADVEVRFVSPAVEPTHAVADNWTRDAALATVVGFLLGVGGAYTLHYLKSSPSKRTE